MRINELAIRHKWNDDIISRMREMINSHDNVNVRALNILKSIEKEYYNNDDVVEREQIAKDRIAVELPEEFLLYNLKYK